MSKAQYAKHRGCGHSSVEYALASGRITAGADGRIDAAKADRDWDRNTEALRARPLPRKPELSKTGGVQKDGNRQAITIGYLERRSEREKKLIERLELDMAIRRRDLIPRKEFERGKQLVDNHVKQLRNALLDLPDRLAGQLAGESDLHHIRDILKREFNLVFERFAAGVPAVA